MLCLFSDRHHDKSDSLILLSSKDTQNRLHLIKMECVYSNLQKLTSGCNKSFIICFVSFYTLFLSFHSEDMIKRFCTSVLCCVIENVQVKKGVNDVRALNAVNITKLFYDQIILITISIDKMTRRTTQTIMMMII